MTEPGPAERAGRESTQERMRGDGGPTSSPTRTQTRGRKFSARPAAAESPGCRLDFARSGEIPAEYRRTEFDRECGLGKPGTCHSTRGTMSMASAATGRLPTHWHSMTHDRRGCTLPVAAVYTARDIVPAPYAPTARPSPSATTRPRCDGRRRGPAVHSVAPRHHSGRGPVCACPQARRDATGHRSTWQRRTHGGR